MHLNQQCFPKDVIQNNDCNQFIGIQNNRSENKMVITVPLLCIWWPTHANAPQMAKCSANSLMLRKHMNNANTKNL